MDEFLCCCTVFCGSVFVDSLFIVGPIVLWGFVYVPCFVVQCFVSSPVLESSHPGRGVVALLVCLSTSYDYQHIRLFLAVWWDGLQCVSVAFPGHTHLHFYSKGSSF